MIAAVLCGGKGTRLREIIGAHQKCVVDVGGRPWLHRVLDDLGNAGVDKAILLTGYQGDEVVAAATAWSYPVKKMGQGEAVVAPRRPAMEVAFLHSKPSGPEAAINMVFAKTKMRSLLIVNGDTLNLGFNLGAFVRDRLTGRFGTVAVMAPSVLDGKVAPSGIVFRVLGSDAVELASEHPYLDIGSPEGLAEARRRFGT